jgi:hypothetical protein
MTNTADELGKREEKGKQDKETIIFQKHFFSYWKLLSHNFKNLALELIEV